MKSLAEITSIVKLSVIALSISTLAACGGGGGGSSTGDSAQGSVSSTSETSESVSTNDSESTSDVLRGQFLDSAVAGLWYETETMSGFTDALGFFEYLPGETVSFFLGATLLGESDGKIEVTPLDLLEVADHPDKLQNILRVLQTLDFDSDPSNGIEIPRATDDYLAQFSMPLNSAAALFEASSVINDIVSTVTNGGDLKDALDSFMHFRETLLSDRRNTTGDIVLNLLNTTWDAEITSTACSGEAASLVYNFNVLGITSMGTHELRVDESGDSCSTARTGIFFNTYETDALFTCANECTAEDLNRVSIEETETGEDEVTALSYDADAGAITIAVTTMVGDDSVTTTTVLTAR
ncbi:hypothetical protein A9Q99_18570 [Gammaproteobacteria bacterium 45_16_T64]|nr:hypothetical protein A9Q99_18570 [Gammaproteobacteria bacterium 45_16_T64]